MLCGEASWRWQQLAELIPPHQNGLAIGEVDADSMLDQLPQASPISVKSLKHQLGQETDFAIFDTELGLDADALAIVIGMIRAGGCCYVCLPPKDDFLSQTNPALRPYLNAPFTLEDTLKGFQNYVWHSLQSHAIWVEQNTALPNLNVSSKHSPPTTLPTADQHHAIEAIHHLAFGHRKRPLVLTADRGRGKSYTLGLACFRLLADGKQHITLTAARRAQLQSAFTALDASIKANMEADHHHRLTLVEKRPGLVIFERNGKQLQVEFKAPDALLAAPLPLTTDVIMVDEAAHLPLPMLQALLQKHPRVLLSTTQQGYEGSGRGFSLKLSHYLQQNFPNWKAVSLSQPIRWNPHDPLEALLNRLLCLQSTFSQPLSESKAPLAFNPQAKVDFMRIDPLAMLKQADGYKTLHSLFQLLSQAHYQTRPNDLMQLLEVPNQQLWIAQANNQLIGVARALYEGELALSTPGRRQQGHLFPQLLAKNSHQPQWRTLKTLRIQRLAIAPEWQNQGIGSQLLKQVMAAQTGLDALTTSFGASPGLVKFWGKAGFLPVHLGIQKDKASGLHSVAMIAPLSATAQTLTAQNGFAHQFSWQLTDSFQNLDTELVYELLSRLKPTLQNDTQFPTGYLEDQPYEAISWALRAWTLAHPACLKQPGLGNFWGKKVLQNHHWSSFAIPRKILETEFKTALYDLNSKQR